MKYLIDFSVIAFGGLILKMYPNNNHFSLKSGTLEIFLCQKRVLTFRGKVIQTGSFF